MSHKKIIIGSIFLSMLYMVGCQPSTQGTATQPQTIPTQMEEATNMVNHSPFISDLPDPYVLKASDDKFYAYGTTDALMGYRVYVSEDMIHWEKKGLVYRSPNTWQGGDFWAPEVYEYQDKFYMFYTAREKTKKSLRLGVAIAEKPDGPFTDISETPSFDFGYAMIDAHVFFDTDGKKYLYYSKDCSENIVNGYHTSQIYGVPLSDDLLTAVGEPVLLISPEGALETQTGEYRWNEGPFVLKHQDLYYLMYSSGYFADATYHISYATAKNPLGPFTKSPNNPLLQSVLEEQFSGPGHNSVFESDQQLYIAYHTHVYKDGGDRRQMNINKLGFDNEGNLEIREPVTK